MSEQFALLAHLYGIQPREVGAMTWTQFRMLLSQVGMVLFLRDRATLNWHFSQINPEHRRNLANGTAPVDPVNERAFEAFIAHYRLKGRARIPVNAAREFLDASAAGRVPEWVFEVAPISEIRAAAGRR